MSAKGLDGSVPRDVLALRGVDVVRNARQILTGIDLRIERREERWQALAGRVLVG